jgi:hypothetical protein
LLTLNFCLIFLDIIERVKISEYYFLCPFFVSRFHLIFQIFKNLLIFFQFVFFIIFSDFFNSLKFCLRAFIFQHICFFLFILYLLQNIEIKLNWNYPLCKSSIIDDFFFNLKWWQIVIPQSKLQNAQCLKQYCNTNISIKLKNTVLIQEN